MPGDGVGADGGRGAEGPGQRGDADCAGQWCSRADLKAMGSGAERGVLGKYQVS